ncbi:hypothetical protein CsSME_00008022 [Camellia sinensis var. sinensis]
MGVECSVNPSFLVPSLASTELIRFKFFRARTSSSNPSRVFRMATEPPSSSSSSPPHSDSSSSSPPHSNSSSVPASSAIDFLPLCHRLKTTKRTRWVRRDVENPESIADRMYRMGLMALK